jgi:hypothetical protein
VAGRFAEFRSALAERTHRLAEAVRDSRPRRPHLPPPPAWLDELRLVVSYRSAEFAGRARLWYARRTAPIHARLARSATAVATRADRIKGALSDLFSPLLWRLARWLDDRAHAAAARRDRLSSRLASLRERRLKPALRAVEDHLPQGATTALHTARSLGAGRLLAAVLPLLLLSLWVRWHSLMRPIPPASDDELRMASGFVTMPEEDASAWLRDTGGRR